MFGVSNTSDDKWIHFIGGVCHIAKLPNQVDVISRTVVDATYGIPLLSSLGPCTGMISDHS